MSGYVDCPDCGDECEVKETKKGKPYYRCDSCGTQHFYRMSEGIARLQGRMKRKEPAKEPAEPKEKPKEEPEKDASGVFGFFS